MSTTEQLIPSYYKIFEKEYEDISTDSLQYIEFYDVNINDVTTLTDFRMDMKDLDNYFLLHKAYLECEFTIVHNNGNPLTGENVSLQNNGVGLFRRWELLFDDKVVESVDDADICNTIQSLVYFSDGYSSSVATNQFWMIDTSMDPVPGTNFGFENRIWYTRESRRVVINIPLINVFGFCKAYDKVIRGVKISLRLDKNTDNRMILTDAIPGGGPYKVMIYKTSLWIPRVKPNLSVRPMLESKLASGNFYRIPFVDAQIFRSPLIIGVANNRLFQVRTKRRRPIKIFVAFQFNVQVDGDQTIVKRIFDHRNLVKLRAVLNAGDQYPEREYSYNFSPPAGGTYNFSRAYGELMRAGFKDDINEGSPITPHSFHELFPIFCIDMSNQPEYQVAPESALIEVYWTDTNVATNHYMWVVVESERKVEIVGSDGKMKFLNVS